VKRLTPQTATSLPRAPREDERSRQVKYLVSMSVRVVCFLLMVLVTPYGWYTWVFGAAAALLPYIAVVIANVGQDLISSTASAPTDQTAEEPATRAVDAHPETPTVITISESTRIDRDGTE
jgi:Protein of unknown function (DUF3099)